MLDWAISGLSCKHHVAFILPGKGKGLLVSKDNKYTSMSAGSRELEDTRALRETMSHGYGGTGGAQN